MIIDCHAHVCACLPGHGSLSPRLMNSIAFRFLRWRFALRGADADTEAAIAATLVRAVEGTPELDAAVVLAFDAVHDPDGRLDAGRTHLYVTNDYALELARRHEKLLFGASIHPYRRDALAELERCAKAGAVLVKWLPVTQAIDPADARCIPFYEALAHLGLPLLSHTGGEQSLPSIMPRVADPALLEPALKRGVTVIAAHCGTRSQPFETSYLETFMRLARQYERCYGDTSALSLPTRSYAYRRLLADLLVYQKLVHGSDWPILPLPPLGQVGLAAARGCLREGNWMRRDVLIKQRLGLDEAYWRRAAQVLRLSGPARAAPHAAPRPSDVRPGHV